jgi:hypothetical protein
MGKETLPQDPSPAEEAWESSSHLDMAEALNEPKAEMNPS